METLSLLHTHVCANGVQIIKESLQVPEMKRACKAVRWPCLLVLILVTFLGWFPGADFSPHFWLSFPGSLHAWSFFIRCQTFCIYLCWVLDIFLFLDLQLHLFSWGDSAGCCLGFPSFWNLSQSGKLGQLEDSSHLFSKFQESLSLFTWCSVS